MRLALYGGSFNPPHVAHQLVCSTVLATAAVDELWMMPTFQHAFDKPLASFDDRVEMCERAVALFGGRVRVSRLEETLPPPSYTLHTVKAILDAHPGTRISLVIGTDLLAERERWHGWPELQTLIDFIVIGRTGWEEGAAQGLAVSALSSTEVRAKLAAGEACDGLLDRSVLSLIRARGLYGAPAPPVDESTLVVGDGRVARALATALAERGPAPRRWWRKLGGKPPATDVAVLAVSDGAVAEVARELSARVVLHTAGRLAALDRAGAGVVHPLRAFGGTLADARLAGSWFGVGGDQAGHAAATALVARLGAHAIDLGAADAERMSRYHAAAVLVSNHSVALVDAGRRLIADNAGRALAELLGSTVENLRRDGLPSALTGPMSRGDVDAVAQHLRALHGDAELSELYRATGRALLSVAAAAGHASPQALAEIARLLA